MEYNFCSVLLKQLKQSNDQGVSAPGDSTPVSHYHLHLCIVSYIISTCVYSPVCLLFLWYYVNGVFISDLPTFICSFKLYPFVHLVCPLVIIDLPILTPGVCVLHWAGCPDNYFWKKPNKATWCLEPTTYVSLLLRESCMRNNNSLQFAVHKHVLILLTFLYWANQSYNLSLSAQKHEPSLKSGHIKAEYITRHFLRLEIRWIAWLNYKMQHGTKICFLLEMNQHVVKLVGM